jgi:4-hydroxy-3-methylbut-2-enyl diphosphate reductase
MAIETERVGSENFSGPKKLFIADPRGLCAGVERSLSAYDLAIAQNPDEIIYSVGQPAHNTHINRRYEEKGVVFVNKVSDVPDNGIALFGPHGTEKSEEKIAKDKRLKVMDTTCPLVVKVEKEIEGYTKDGVVTIYWGDRDHQEAKAAVSAGDVILVESAEEALSKEVFEKTKDKNGVAFASQTTFNADEAIEIEKKLKEIYPDLIVPRVPDRCYATRNRQAAVKMMIESGATAIVIVGSPQSSNSRRLYEIAVENGAKAVFVDSSEEVDAEVFSNEEAIGFESGASVEEEKFQEVVKKFEERFSLKPKDVMYADESKIKFAPVLPKFAWED